MNGSITKSLAALPLALLLGACATAPVAPAARADLQGEAADALRRMEADDPGLASSFLAGAHAYAVFPRVAKGGWWLGGSYGRGVVYRAGAPIGYADITGASVGLQFGGQAYAELLVFEDEAALRRFTSGQLSAGVDLSAVVLKTGAAGAARYDRGVAVFVRPLGGAMIEAAVGAQQFTFQPG